MPNPLTYEPADLMFSERKLSSGRTALSLLLFLIGLLASIVVLLWVVAIISSRYATGSIAILPLVGGFVSYPLLRWSFGQWHKRGAEVPSVALVGLSLWFGFLSFIPGWIVLGVVLMARVPAVSAS